MKFYNREKEIEILAKADSFKFKQAIMTILTGRRRVGKTTLALKNYSADKVLYFFVSKKSEQLLCEEFILQVTTKINTKIYGKITKFEQLFEYLLEISKTIPLTLIIDEFQEFYRINESIYSSIQKLWDLNKKSSKIHFIACGSIYSLMKRIYEDAKEPLFGRADFKIELKPLKITVLKEILIDNNNYSASNLLDFYMLTGGVAKYIELFCLYSAFDVESMIDVICQENSIFLEEGKFRLIEEFGKEYAIYFSILALISNSKTSRSEIESILEKNISGHLSRLENDYNIIKSIKPINAKPNSKVQKYEIVDNFLSFWFRFVYKYQSLIEAENFTGLKEIIRRDIVAFKGKFLEKLFIEILKEKQRFSSIGSYWDRKNESEIDIVAVDGNNKKLLICEVKLNPKRLALDKLIVRSQKVLRDFKSYDIEYKLLSLDDIYTFID
jgi:AAA+ ATPase superfamily predicted ATPase